jgi:dTMP kinase
MRASERRFYGTALPGVDLSTLTGKLIVIEGADGSGRSTQILMLKEWLEGAGFACVDVGLARSTLVSRQLERAKEGNVLGHSTLSLFYATDFADQLENRIIPALMAGFIVLADRYIYTPMVRDLVRGADPEWVREVYSIGLVPDLVFYLRVSPRILVERNFRKSVELDFWESGMDVGLSRDRFDSFVRYQTLVQRHFADMQKDYGFITVNANRTPRTVNREIRVAIEQMLREDADSESVPDALSYRPSRGLVG